MRDEKLTAKINIELEALQNRMKNTIQEEEERGASLHQLGKKTERLEERAHVFENTASETEWKMWFKVVKWYVLIAGIVIFVLLMIFYK